MSDHKSNKIEAVIMAGEIEDNFQSETPFLYHTIAGQPIINFTVNATKEVVGDLPTLALVADVEDISQQLAGSFKRLIHAEQRSDVQTLRQIGELLAEDIETILLVRADMPLLTSTSLEQFVSAHLAAADSNTPISLLTVTRDGASGNPIIVRDENGVVTGVSNTSRTSNESPPTNPFGWHPVVYPVRGIYPDHCLARGRLQLVNHLAWLGILLTANTTSSISILGANTM